MERTNTSGVELKPSGHYVLEIEKVIKKSIGKEGGKQWPGYEWKFTVIYCDKDLDDNNFKLFMFKSQMGELLRAVGAKEVAPQEFEWEMADVPGKKIECELVHVNINGKDRESLIDVKEYKEEKSNVKVKPSGEEVAWDE